MSGSPRPAMVLATVAVLALGAWTGTAQPAAEEDAPATFEAWLLSGFEERDIPVDGEGRAAVREAAAFVEASGLAWTVRHALAATAEPPVVEPAPDPTPVGTAPDHLHPGKVMFVCLWWWHDCPLPEVRLGIPLWDATGLACVRLVDHEASPMAGPPLVVEYHAGGMTVFPLTEMEAGVGAPHSWEGGTMVGPGCILVRNSWLVVAVQDGVFFAD